VRADRLLALARSQRLAHMVGANWFFVALAAHARRGGGELRQWQGERATAEYLYDQARMTASVLEVSPHPDGLGIWAEDGTDIVFLLEYDTGSEHLPQLTGKLDRYAHLATDQMAFQVPICSAAPPRAASNPPAAPWPTTRARRCCRSPPPRSTPR